ncbi:MAG: NADH-quinone oxidoreductase subunit C [Deltaproteobacteria bacterium]|nr:NADH-quinone oxidoreductase subunit C [Deltaproteobacteria bacterium]
MAFETKNIAKNQLLEEVQTLKNKGYRFVTMSCVDLGDSFDLLYHFELNMQLKHLRITLLKNDTAPSISGIFLAAFLIENESKDHFGVNFEGMALDFGGHLYLEDEVKKFPFCKVTVSKNETAGEGA